MADIWQTITNFGVGKTICSILLVVFVGWVIAKGGKGSGSGNGGGNNSGTSSTPPAA